MAEREGPDFTPSLAFLSAGLTARGRPASTVQLAGAGAGVLRAAGEVRAVAQA